MSARNEDAVGETGRDTAERHEAAQGEDSRRSVERHAVLRDRTWLGDESDGIMELPDDANVGAALIDLSDLPDAVIDLDLTPNRGDCFSVLGIARDVSALTGAPLKDARVEPVAATINDTHPVELVEPAGCPRFAGRLIRGIDPPPDRRSG